MDYNLDGFYVLALFLGFLLLCWCVIYFVADIKASPDDPLYIDHEEILSFLISFLGVTVILNIFAITIIKEDIKDIKLQQKFAEEEKLEEESAKLEYKNCINNSHVEEYECYLCIDKSSTNCLSYIKTSCKKTVYDVDDSDRCERIVESNKTKAKGWEGLLN